jgi:hypothetical protein
MIAHNVRIISVEEGYDSMGWVSGVEPGESWRLQVLSEVETGFCGSGTRREIPPFPSLTKTLPNRSPMVTSS